jgi:type IV secretion system protein VirD4
VSSQPARPGGGQDLGLGLVLGAAAASVLLWLGGAGSAFFSGHEVPHGHPLAGLVTLAHPLQPARAWGAPVGPVALYWAMTGLVFVVAESVAYGAIRVVRAHGPSARPDDDPRRGEGLATRRQVKAAAGERALLDKAAVLRPSLSRPTAAELGVRLGRSHGIACFSCVRDSLVVLGPPGAGKGLHLVIPMILDAPGPVITTSTRPDNLAVALSERGRHGPVAVFDPQGLARGVPSATRWSPIRGCEAPQVAMARAQALAGEAARGTEHQSFWTQQTLQATRCLLHAAALGGRSAVDLYRWSLSPANAKEAIEILRSEPNAALSWSRALDAIVGGDQRTRDSIWAMVANAFSALADPAVLDAVSPGPEESFSPEAFLRSKGSVFLLGTATGASATSGLVAAFIEDVAETARRLAAASPEARLDPPLSLVLDEAAHYPLPSLASLMAEGGGSGICTTVVLQSLAQARDRFGAQAAQALWDAASVKVILGGQANASDLADLARLVGDVEVEETSTSYGYKGERSLTRSKRPRPILSPAQLRTLSFGTGVLLLRSAPPIPLCLEAWTTRSDAGTLVADKERLEDTLRKAVGDAHG